MRSRRRWGRWRRCGILDSADLDNVNFVGNDEPLTPRLSEVLELFAATPEQIDKAVELDVEERLITLKIGFLILVSISIIAALPGSYLPKCRLDDGPGSVTVAQTGTTGSVNDRGVGLQHQRWHATIAQASGKIPDDGA